MTAIYIWPRFTIGLVVGPIIIFAAYGLEPLATFAAFAAGIVVGTIPVLVLDNTRPLWWVRRKIVQDQRKVLLDLADQVDRGALAAKTIEPALRLVRHAEVLRRRSIAVRFDDQPQESYLLDLQPRKVPARPKGI